MREWYNRWFPPGTERRLLLWVGVFFGSVVVMGFACAGVLTLIGSGVEDVEQVGLNHHTSLCRG